MKTFRVLFAAVLIAGFGAAAAVAQAEKSVDAPRGQVVEVTYFKGRTLAYQRVGEWTWYELFPRIPDWKPAAGQHPVAAVKVTPRLEGNVIRARITVLRGANHETEDLVADYPLSASRVAVSELTNFGVVPFELSLVRAPATVAEPPSVVNKTKSIQVSIEPAASSLPSFRARFLNNSSKPIAAFALYTTLGGQRRLSAMPQNRDGQPIIAAGAVHERFMRYPLKPITESTGEVPPALPDLTLTVAAAVFADGTWEGDPAHAARYLAANFGEKKQLERFISLIRSKGFKGGNAEIEEAAAAAFDETMFQEFLKEFPGLAADDGKMVRAAIEFGKSEAVKLIRRDLSERGKSAVSDAELFKALADRYQSRVDMLP